jgi:hypothetical protein
MALSASYNFTVTRDEISTAALRKLGVVAEGQTPNSNQLTTAAQAQNVMLKAWQGDAMPLWQIRTGYVYPLHNVNNVQLYSSGGHWTDELILTKLTADAAASATSLTVSITAATDVTGTTANSDNIGIELDDGTMHWTTISSGGGTTSLTIASGLASAASSGNRVYAYTSKAQRPESIVDVYRVYAETAARDPLTQVPLRNFLALNSQTTEGEPNTWAYEESVTAVPGSNPGNFKFWPRFADGARYLEVRYQMPFDDMDASSDNLAFPDSWYEAVIYGLAVRLAPEYQIPLDQRQVLKGEAKAAKDIAEVATQEFASLFFQPQVRR